MSTSDAKEGLGEKRGEESEEYITGSGREEEGDMAGDRWRAESVRRWAIEKGLGL